MSKADQRYNPFQGESGQITIQIDPKVKYLSELNAKEGGHSLAMFIELCLRQVLVNGGLDEEPTPGTVPRTRYEAPMHNEGFWDDDPIERFLTLATCRPSALTPRARKLWDETCDEASKNGSFNNTAVKKVLTKRLKELERKSSK